jgi:FkbM family methyltransferase
MKRKLLGLANAAISPLGVQLYKCGMDMESIVRQLAKRAIDVRTIVDIGASDGRWSKAAMPHFPHAKFIALDPLIEREPKLRKLKDSSSNFDYLLCVAGEKDRDTVSLTVGDDLDGSTVGGSEGVVRTVPSHSIDAIVAMKQCAGPFILKFDTHGFEVPILNGAVKTLKSTHYIVMEVYNYRHTGETLLFYEMCSLLDSLGFRCFNMADPMLRPLDGTLWQMDLFFARKDDEFFRYSWYRKSSNNLRTI